MAGTDVAIGTAIVTGAAQRLGYGIAAALAAARYDVAIVDVDGLGALRAAAEIADRGVGPWA